MTDCQSIDLPSYELVQRFMHEAGFTVPDPDVEPAFPRSKFMKLASRLIRYGADMELVACCEWLEDRDLNVDTYKLRRARRPKPPSLKEQALESLHHLEAGGEPNIDLLRRALEALPESSQ